MIGMGSSNLKSRDALVFLPGIPGFFSFLTHHKHPRLTELGIFPSQAFNFFSNVHIVSRGKFPRQRIHLLPEQLFD
jgi:hypothetical protein